MSNEKNLHEGPAVGGPFDGQTLQSRFPKGVLVVAVPDALAWVYDRDEEGRYIARNGGKAERFIQSKAAKAAEEPNYDVRAYDDGEIPADLEVGL